MKIYSLIIFFIAASYAGYAQQITGAWKGKINGKTVELKIIQKGDSLTGTSYYTGSSKTNVRRYSIKGYFDVNTNSVVWWDDDLISDKSSITDRAYISVADFNCPGGGRMFLDGKSSGKEDNEDPKGTVSLTKVERSSIKDEWDFVIDNFNEGGNDPGIIDSISKIAFTRASIPQIIASPSQPHNEKAAATIPQTNPTNAPIKKESVPIVVTSIPQEMSTPSADNIQKKLPRAPLTIDEMFASRKQILNREIHISGDSVQLKFYDNAEVDGDSISLYLNSKLIFTHIRLTGNAYTIMLPVKELADDNELVMVAENLGSIPPNTAFMVALVGDKRHEAYLESTENSSCLIRLTKLH